MAIMGVEMLICRSGWILHLLATLGYFFATIYFTLPSVSVSPYILKNAGTTDIKEKEDVHAGCRTPIPPLEGLVNEKSGKSGHIALETV
jgi:hypothetical protein